MDSPAPRAFKRARTEDGDAPIVRSDKIWYDDGNLVIQAERTQFRVHRGILSKQSVFFRDMKDLPQPSNAAEALVDGCPVIELQDEAEDVWYMLHCIYDTALLTRPPSFPELLTSLRMGHKYLVAVMFDSAADRLRAEFPSAIERYSEVEFSRFTTSADNNHFELLPVVKAVGLETVMPALYFFYVNFRSAPQIAAGCDIVDVDVCSRSSAVLPSAEDRLMLLVAFNKILRSQDEYSLRWIWKGSDSCSRPTMCDKARTEYREARFSVFDGTVDLCKWCTITAKQLHEEGRDMFWKVLSSFFGLKPWEELRDFQIEWCEAIVLIA
ncbi:hypothetical protein BD626DRAFT_516849 [Schizophyllum amplum]|uniref:BTB domain-containing protein n=1 Tax=Schizophyllum amplum TaxID=97359 RepID=A0A550BWM9_9AGAR|nr:hypothetical protein BD626DRAFT_516849 [Auriculariopsis ampla]